MTLSSHLELGLATMARALSLENELQRIRSDFTHHHHSPPLARRVVGPTSLNS